MREIPLTRGKVATVDDEDYERLAKHKWQARLSHGSWRAHRITARPARRNVSMHREILPVPEGFQVDHINGDGLDNRRVNLRQCTLKENVRSMHARRGRSGFKGVFEKRPKDCTLRKPFLVQIVVDQKQINLGYHATAEEGARAYDAAAKKYFGAFAQLNFPEVTQ